MSESECGDWGAFERQLLVSGINRWLFLSEHFGPRRGNASRLQLLYNAPYAHFMMEDHATWWLPIMTAPASNYDEGPGALIVIRSWRLGHRARAAPRPILSTGGDGREIGTKPAAV